MRLTQPRRLRSSNLCSSVIGRTIGQAKRTRSREHSEAVRSVIAVRLRRWWLQRQRAFSFAMLMAFVLCPEINENGMLACIFLIVSRGRLKDRTLPYNTFLIKVYKCCKRVCKTSSANSGVEFCDKFENPAIRP